MGCEYYEVEGVQVRISEDNPTPCLCTYFIGGNIKDVAPDTIRSLAMLGMAVVISKRNPQSHFISIPEDLPDAFIAALDTLLPQGNTDSGVTLYPNDIQAMLDSIRYYSSNGTRRERKIASLLNHAVRWIMATPQYKHWTQKEYATHG